MNSIRTIAFVLLLGGVLALLYGGFSYTKSTSAAKIGSMEISVKRQKTVDIPTWAGIGALLLGGALFVTGGKRRPHGNT